MKRGAPVGLPSWLALALFAQLAIFATCVILPLGFDEAYYSLWGDKLLPHYYDHPPLIGWLYYLLPDFLFEGLGSRFFLGLLSFASLLFLARILGGEFSSRVLPAFLCLPTLAVYLYSAVPDSPQMLSLIWCYGLLFLYLRKPSAAKAAGLGGLAALALLSRYSAIFAVLPALFAGLKKGRLLHLLIAFSLGLLVSAPHLYGLFISGFNTLSYYAGRLDQSIDVFRVLIAITSLVLLCNPALLWFWLKGIRLDLKRGKAEMEFRMILSGGIVLHLAGALLVSFFSPESYPNWFLGFLPLLLFYVITDQRLSKSWKELNPSLAYSFIISLLMTGFLFYAVSVPSKTGIIAQQFKSWQPVGSQFREVCGERKIYSSDYNLISKLAVDANMEVNYLPRKSPGSGRALTPLGLSGTPSQGEEYCLITRTHEIEGLNPAPLLELGFGFAYPEVCPKASDENRWRSFCLKLQD